MTSTRWALVASLTLLAPPFAAAAVHKIQISSASYEPTTIEVKKGDTIEWVNTDLVPHTVTGKGLKSGKLEPEGTFRYTAEKKGKIPYHCDYHVNMTGMIVVK